MGSSPAVENGRETVPHPRKRHRVGSEFFARVICFCLIVGGSWPARCFAAVEVPENLAGKIGEIRQLTETGGLREAVPFTLDGVAGTTFIFRKTEWGMGDPQSPRGDEAEREKEYMALPEGERAKFMRRTDNDVQLWVVEKGKVRTSGVEKKKAIHPKETKNEYYREVIYLGEDEGLMWFGYMPISQWMAVQKKLSLEGGEDPCHVALRGLAVKDTTHAMFACPELLSNAGVRALPLIEEAIAAKNPQREMAICAMRGNEEEIVDFMIKHSSSTDPVVAKAARGSLLGRRLKKLEKFYLRWLDEGAGKRPVRWELSLCAEFKTKEAAPILPRILSSPTSVEEYWDALCFSRALAGGSIPPELLKAEDAIGRHGCTTSGEYDEEKVSEAVEVLSNHSDHEAAAAIGVVLALQGDHAAKGQALTENNWPVRRSGVQVLRRLPGDAGRKLVELLARTATEGNTSATSPENLRKLRDRL